MSVEDLSGRELDAAVAEEVLGCEVFWEQCASGDEPRCDCPGPNSPDPRPHGQLVYGWLKDYSTDIAAAWEVVEHATGREWMVDLSYRGGWHCHVSRDDWDAQHHGNADTAPLAICRAALKAVRDS